MIDRADYETDEEYQNELQRIAEIEEREAKRTAETERILDYIKNSPAPSDLDKISYSQPPTLAFSYILAEIARLREKLRKIPNEQWTGRKTFPVVAFTRIPAMARC